jgi:hypothetical protein
MSKFVQNGGRFHLLQVSRLLTALSLLFVANSEAWAATTVSAQHSPLYYTAPHTSTIHVSAESTTGGIDSLRIEVTRGEMTDCSELGEGPSLIPCRKEATLTVHTCDFTPALATATCDFELSITSNEIITYKAVASPTSGASESTTTITYSGGGSLLTSTLRPIWWHTDDPVTSVFTHRIDLGFFPDEDYGTPRPDFDNDVGEILQDVFFNASKELTRAWTENRFQFNLWAGPPGANGEGCAHMFDAQTAPVRAALDGAVIFHELGFRDCATISLGGGSGTVFANDVDPGWILIHEGSHFLLGLGDEYCCDGGYYSASTPKNLFDSKDECEDAEDDLAISASPSNCTEITAGGKWRIDQGLSEIMESPSPTAAYQNSSNQAFDNKMADCLDGSCY